MGYFRVDERYRDGAKAPVVEAPWQVQVQDTGTPGQVHLRWRPPYTPVDSYGVYGQSVEAAAGGWRELARVPGTLREAGLRLDPGAWHLAVGARRAGVDSPRSPVASAAPMAAGAVIQVAAGPREPGALPTPVPPDPGVTLYDLPPTARDPPPWPDLAPAARPPPPAHCTCCVPPGPLVWHAGALVCAAHPDRRYGVPLPFGDGRNDPRPRRAPPPPAGLVPEPAPELDWPTIDRALRANSAQLGRHGLFVRPAPRDYDER